MTTEKNRKNELEKSLKNSTNNENYKNSIKCLLIVLFPQLSSILSDSETYEEFTEEQLSKWNNDQRICSKKVL
jgi:hypothetical protein